MKFNLNTIEGPTDELLFVVISIVFFLCSWIFIQMDRKFISGIKEEGRHCGSDEWKAGLQLKSLQQERSSLSKQLL